MLHARDKPAHKELGMSTILHPATELEQALDLELIRHVSYESELQEVIKVGTSLELEIGTSLELEIQRHHDPSYRAPFPCSGAPAVQVLHEEVAAQEHSSLRQRQKIQELDATNSELRCSPEPKS